MAKETPLSPEQRKVKILFQVGYFDFLKQNPRLKNALNDGVVSIENSEINFYEKEILNEQDKCDHSIEKGRISVLFNSKLTEHFCATCGKDLMQE